MDGNEAGATTTTAAGSATPEQAAQPGNAEVAKPDEPKFPAGFRGHAGFVDGPKTSGAGESVST